MKALAIFLFFSLTLDAYAQNELFVISRGNEKQGARIAKGSFLKVEMQDGTQYSGTLVKVKAYTIELMRYSAVINIDEIAELSIVYGNGKASLFPIEGWGILYTFPHQSRYKAKFWEFIVKEK